MDAKAATQRHVDQFLSMVNISSTSRDEGALAVYLKQELETLGFSVEFDAAGEKVGGNSGNLIAIATHSNAASVSSPLGMIRAGTGVSLMP